MSQPETYTLVQSTEMERDEVVALFRKSGWSVEDHEIENIHPLSDGGGTNVSVGLRDTYDELIAYGGLILRDSEWAEMGDLMVHPAHRHKGLGKWLISERLTVADSNGIIEITIEDLEDTNPLRSYYEEHGFDYSEEQEAFIRTSSSST